MNFLVVFLLVNLPIMLSAQELEPRALLNVPVGMNFLFFGYGYSQGNILPDPAAPIEDPDSRLHTLVGAYIRSLKAPVPYMLEKL